MKTASTSATIMTRSDFHIERFRLRGSRVDIIPPAKLQKPVCPAPPLNRFKQRIREITRRAKGVSIKTTMDELAPFMRGWRGYFGYCETPDVLMYLTRWVRLRLRAALWRQWKTQRRRRAALLALGVHQRLASNTAGSSRGAWYLARAKALSVGLSNAYFKSLGLPSLIEPG
jgi:RNA-directed DNA polymerase